MQSLQQINPISDGLPMLRKLAHILRSDPLSLGPRLRAKWSAFSLAGQFVVAASAVMVAGMVVLGLWVTSQIEAGVVRNTAFSTVFYLDSYLEPLVQALGAGEVLPEPAQTALNRVLAETHLGEKIVAIEVKSRTGATAFSSKRANIGVVPSMLEGSERAMRGEIYSELSEVEAKPGGKDPIPVLRIVSPLHKLASSQVIATAGIHLDATELRRDVQKARLVTVLVVACVTALMLTTLYTIVRRGSITIGEQRIALEDRVEELSRFLAQNESLRRDLVDARARGVAMNERIMRRIGADLHDGPAQLIGLALMRFSDLDPSISGIERESRQRVYDLLRDVLGDSLQDIRSISYGIAPPELDGISLAKAIELAARNHEKRTGTKVECRLGVLPSEVPALIKTSVYRFAQEGLSNAFRHGGGLCQQLEASCSGTKIVVRVGDEGEGFTPDAASLSGGLGLAGLRDRIESIGGEFTVKSAAGSGTWLTAAFDLA